MKRREFIVALAATATFPVTTAFAATNADILTVHKDPNCGCCSLWADAYEKAGYRVEIVEEGDLLAIKQKLGVPLDMQGCHTAVYRGQFLEGHVPLEATRMLESRTDLAGLVVPGMPAGSLGMGDDPSATYDVIGVGKDGRTSVFLEVRPKI
ncbi:DUF411 domain-containing protein [Shinella sp. CPCC 100929]|uniref:DUF411 domain-containing protein n=1 Tax=Shinella lacus TaxID=2654216 RepID=A0ABT1RDY9_9HYPH|nr:DUF411 domain-containing protein [Shinella lacus]MCQ4633406.1 DUF411 domain-containing protein [Shinella lacus]